MTTPSTQAISERFLDLFEAAARGELAHLEETPDGALALVILLDQFPRNLFRGLPRTYATDARGPRRHQAGPGEGLPPIAATGSSRSSCICRWCTPRTSPTRTSSLAYFEKLGLADNLRAARRHRGIIARFGRFPHRNEILGRATTPEEQRYLDEGGFKG